MRSRGRIWFVGVVAAVAVAFACMDADPAQPFGVVAGPLYELTGGPVGGPANPGEYGSAGLVTPPTNLVTTPWTNAGTIPAGRLARVKVQGKLTFSVNPAYQLCAGSAPPALPGGLSSVGPAGLPNGFNSYAVLVEYGGAQPPQSGGHRLSPTDPAAAVVTELVQGPWTVWAWRPSVLPYACGSGGSTQPAYFVSGGQTVTLETLDSASMTADRGEVYAGDTVAFEVVPPTWAGAAALPSGWQWVTDSGATSTVSGCGQGLECRLAPQVSGSMRAVVFVGGIASYRPQSARVQVVARPDSMPSDSMPRDSTPPDSVPGDSLPQDSVPPPLHLSISARARLFTGDSSFTAKSTVPPEDTVGLEAVVQPATFASRVEWRVERDPTASPDTPLPADIPQGGRSFFRVGSLVRELGERQQTRWPEAPSNHARPLPLAPKRLSYRITAFIRDAGGATYESSPIVAAQDEVDVLREEYVELGHSRGIPRRNEFAIHVPCNLVCVNTGDYLWAIVNTRFAERLNTLRIQWIAENRGTAENRLWQVNVIYRNPVHNRFHGVGRASLRSFHLDGCAADLHTFANGARFLPERIRRLFFFNRLNTLASRLGFDFESLAQVGGDPRHVHVELDPCPIPAR